MPRPISALAADAQASALVRQMVGVLCDIDDTVTWHGRIVPEALLAMQRMQQAGLKVVPVTGRPGGWVDHVARMWPVDGCVGENGGLWFWMNRFTRDDGSKGERLERRFLQSAEIRSSNRARLDSLAAEILGEVPGTALASDQPYRELDLAIDFCEDVPPLPRKDIDRIVAAFERRGATCKVSSIHVNGWFGDFDKIVGFERFHRDAFGSELDPSRWAFFGDSANDSPMFGTFPLSVGVANVAAFLDRMPHAPTWITEGSGGHGFVEGVEALLSCRG